MQPYVRSMKKEVNITWISPGSLFRLLLVGFFCSLAPLFLLGGVISLFGVESESFIVNGEPASGVIGAFAYVVGAVAFPLMVSVWAWVFLVAGLWVYSKLHRRLGALTLRYEEARDQEEEERAA